MKKVLLFIATSLFLFGCGSGSSSGDGGGSEAEERSITEQDVEQITSSLTSGRDSAQDDTYNGSWLRVERTNVKETILSSGEEELRTITLISIINMEDINGEVTVKFCDFLDEWPLEFDDENRVSVYELFDDRFEGGVATGKSNIKFPTESYEVDDFHDTLQEETIKQVERTLEYAKITDVVGTPFADFEHDGETNAVNCLHYGEYLLQHSNGEVEYYFDTDLHATEEGEEEVRVSDIVDSSIEDNAIVATDSDGNTSRITFY